MRRTTWPGVTLGRRQVLLGRGAVGAFFAVDVGALAWASGRWPSRRLTQGDFVDAFRNVSGEHAGYRLNHSKGVAVTGYFDSNGNGREITTAAVFAAGRTPVTGRYSLSGGNPGVADAAGTARGLGLAFGYPYDAQWRTAMLNLPVFPDNSPEGFRDRLLASKPVSATGKPDPVVMDRFLTAHPETKAAMQLINAQRPSSGFADSTYRSLNAFYFIGPSGTRTPVRWSMEPVEPALPAAAAQSGHNWLFDDLIRRIQSRPLAYRLLLTVGRPSDPVADATLPWPADRRVIDAGTVTLTSVASEARGNARDINFDPTVLPDGIQVSADPLLSARSAVYAASFRRRAADPDVPPSVDVARVTA